MIRLVSIFLRRSSYRYDDRSTSFAKASAVRTSFAKASAGAELWRDKSAVRTSFAKASAGAELWRDKVNANKNRDNKEGGGIALLTGGGGVGVCLI